MSSTYNRLLVLGWLKSIIPIVSWLVSFPSLFSFCHPFNAKSNAFRLKPAISSCKLSYIDLAEDVIIAESPAFDETSKSFANPGAAFEKDKCNRLIINKQKSSNKTLTFLIMFILKLFQKMPLLHQNHAFCQVCFID